VPLIGEEPDVIGVGEHDGRCPVRWSLAPSRDVHPMTIEMQLDLGWTSSSSKTAHRCIQVWAPCAIAPIEDKAGRDGVTDGDSVS